MSWERFSDKEMCNTIGYIAEAAKMKENTGVAWAPSSQPSHPHHRQKLGLGITRLRGKSPDSMGSGTAKRLYRWAQLDGSTSKGSLITYYLRHRGHRAQSFVPIDLNELVELRARQRTFEGAYARTALGNLGYALTVLKLFDRRFYRSSLFVLIWFRFLYSHVSF